MDIGGRLNQVISNEKVDEQATYELVFKTGNYWEKVMNDKNYQNIIQEIVIRFKMPNNNKKYHEVKKIESWKYHRVKTY